MKTIRKQHCELNEKPIQLCKIVNQSSENVYRSEPRQRERDTNTHTPKSTS